MRIGTKYKRALAGQSYDAIVVGSGLGGLCCASFLAKAGKRVLVLERHYVAGGFTHTFARKGYEWDVGLHYVGQVHRQRSALRRIFDDITGGQLKWTKMPEVYDRLIFPDRSYELVAGQARFKEELLKHFPAEEAAITKYLDLIREVNHSTGPFFGIRTAPPRVHRLLSLVLGKKFLSLSDQTTLAVLKTLTKDERLIGVLSGQYGDYGLPPAMGSFVAQALVAGHYMDGGNYPVGGSSQIAISIIAELKKRGGEVLIQADVESILTKGDRGKRAVGVRLKNGDELKAPLIISDVGARNTFTSLLKQPPKPHIAKGLGEIKSSASHVCLYIGLKKTAAELGITPTNLWIYSGYDHDASVQAFLDDPAAAFPVVYVSFPSTKDPTWEARYPGRSTIEVIGFAPFEWFKKWQNHPTNDRGQDYEAFKEQLSQRLLAELYKQVPSVQGHVDHHELSTPLTTAHFANYAEGEIYGLEHSPQRFRQRWLMPHTPVKGLFLTGQDIVMDGISGALVSGALTASTILKRNVVKGALLRTKRSEQDWAALA